MTKENISPSTPADVSVETRLVKRLVGGSILGQRKLAPVLFNSQGDVNLCSNYKDSQIFQQWYSKLDYLPSLCCSSCFMHLPLSAKKEMCSSSENARQQYLLWTVTKSTQAKCSNQTYEGVQKSA